MRLEPKTKLYSVRQAARLTGKMERTIYRYMLADKIDYVAVDHLRFIPESQIEKIKNTKCFRHYHKPRHVMEGHVSIVRFAWLTGTKPFNIRAYALRGQLEYTTNKKGIYFIPDHVVELWKQFDKPNPSKIEAAAMGAVTVQNAAIQFGYSNNQIKIMIKGGELKKVQGTLRWYVLQDSIDKYKLIGDLVEEL